MSETFLAFIGEIGGEDQVVLNSGVFIGFIHVYKVDTAFSLEVIVEPLEEFHVLVIQDFFGLI